MNIPESTDHTKRDSETFLIIGIFVVLIGIPVILGALWENDFHARVITVISALALFIIGGGMSVRGLQLRRRGTRNT